MPVVAAGGMADGRSMAAAFALGAEGVQMGTRMLSSQESGVHWNMKQAVLDAAETDTMLINRHNNRPVRVLRTPTTEPFELSAEGDPMELLGNTLALYDDGEFEGTLPQLGAVAGRIEEILPGRRDHPPHRRGVRRRAGWARRPLPRCGEPDLTAWRSDARRAARRSSADSVVSFVRLPEIDVATAAADVGFRRADRPPVDRPDP